MHTIDGTVGQRLRILLVNGDESLAEVFWRFLERGFDVEIAVSAEEAVALLDSRPYHAVVAGSELPGHDGRWLLGVAARRPPAPRRILLESVSVGRLFELLDGPLSRP
jgi:DNA-binding response OmpR family regulator